MTIYIALRKYEKKTAVNQEKHLFYVDLQKTFDRVLHSKLWQTPQKLSVQNLYKDSKKKSN